ncbi:MAG TPA: diguanylate cyclase [Deltaproteobacteria bacterium]|nr:diguanylate cyclase [Deltaproteobacteria bacterium]HQB37686.1 diguanylate cyclase [Deltaproteobacteria bacterium]
MSSENEMAQIFETLSIGLVILDRELIVRHWNRWMSVQSGIPAEHIIGGHLFAHFPELDNNSFNKNCKMVLSFGNFAFFSQKLHNYLFPFKPGGTLAARFTHMQQSCTMGPIRAEDNTISRMFLVVQDVTELASYEQRLVEMNTRDSLSGIYNRRFLEKRLQDEYERHRRYCRELAVLMIDIDFFKMINDNYGHQCGDEVIRSVAEKIAAVIRCTDVVARYGGEEFCCLLPETGLAGAGIVAENIRQQIEAMRMVFDGHTIEVTVSLGLSALKKGDTPQLLLKRADDALYRAKQSGRNRVVTM